MHIGYACHEDMIQFVIDLSYAMQVQRARAVIYGRPLCRRLLLRKRFQMVASLYHRNPVNLNALAAGTFLSSQHASSHEDISVLMARCGL